MAMDPAWPSTTVDRICDQRWERRLKRLDKPKPGPRWKDMRVQRAYGPGGALSAILRKPRRGQRRPSCGGSARKRQR